MTAAVKTQRGKEELCSKANFLRPSKMEADTKKA
jgi:hypothetical protein